MQEPTALLEQGKGTWVNQEDREFFKDYGMYVASSPSGAIVRARFTNSQIKAEIEGSWRQYGL